jgi:hypothetical protein
MGIAGNHRRYHAVASALQAFGDKLQFYRTAAQAMKQQNAMRAAFELQWFEVYGRYNSDGQGVGHMGE